MTKEEVLNKLKNQGRKVIILRGLPGSGKSTFVGDLEGLLGPYGAVSEDLQVCSADHFFVVEKTGDYQFNPHLLKQAHASCRDNFHYWAAKRGPKKPIYLVVDNTNTSMKEMDFYLKEADEYRWDVVIITFNTDIDTSIRRNIHGVPPETIIKMDEQLKNCKLPEGIEHYTIDT